MCCQGHWVTWRLERCHCNAELQRNRGLGEGEGRKEGRAWVGESFQVQTNMAGKYQQKWWIFHSAMLVFLGAFHLCFNQDWIQKKERESMAGEKKCAGIYPP